MKTTLSGLELVAQWRNHAEANNPAGSLFSGEFAEAEIVWEPGCSSTGPPCATPTCWQ
jgi:hypothetical protein